MTRFERSVLFITVFLLAGQAGATFEIEDPAAEFAKETPEANVAVLAGISCHDFLRDGAGRSKAFEEATQRVYAYYRHTQPGSESPPRESDLKEFCIDHPRNSLKDAADAAIQKRL